MANEDQEQARKRAFFEYQDDVHNLSDEDDFHDPTRDDARRTLEKYLEHSLELAAKRCTPSRSNGEDPVPHPIVREEVSSKSPIRNGEKKKDMSSILQKQNRYKRLKPEASVSDTTEFYKRMGNVPKPLTASKAKAKTGNSTSIQLFPKSRQVLKDKIVYLFPNNDVAPLRRKRIHLIIQLGAAWTRVWRKDITHVVVDDDTLTYGDLLEYLQVSRLPESVVLVKYAYIADCMSYRILLNHHQGKYQVAGVVEQIEPRSAEIVIPDSQETDFTSSPLRASPAPQLASDTQDQGQASLGTSYNDPLSEVLEQVRSDSQLPRDDDESVSSPAEEPSKLPGENIERVQKASQGGFRCMDPNHDRCSQNPNAATIKVLQELVTYYDRMKDQWRVLGYRKAINILAKQTAKITTKEEAIRLPYIGESIATKIEEIVQTNGLRKLNSIRDNPMEKVLRLFLSIYSVGLAQAKKWYHIGHRSLEDLRTNPHTTPLTANQIIGIERYDDFAARIPRHEVAAHGEIVRTALQHLDPACSVTIMGSYRCGATDSGDIDLLISKPNAPLFMLCDIIFSQFLPHLVSISFIKATLATSGPKTMGSKWHGASCLPNSTIWRRLDILLVPDTELGASLLYFTGNDVFNRSIRLVARRKGMRLNQHGLFGDVVRGKGAKRINDGRLIEAKKREAYF